MLKKWNTLILLIVATLVTAGLSGCGAPADSEEDSDIAELSMQSGFAQYHEVPVDAKPSVASYIVHKDLGNVINKDKFEFSDEALELLAKNHFVVIPTGVSEFFNTYEMNRYDSTPNFITTDAMLHNYHLFFSHLLRTVEQDYLYGELCTLTESMLRKSKNQYEDLKKTDWENAAKRNVAFFSVASKLLNPEVDIPGYAKREVEDELALISAHQETFADSPVMNLGSEAGNPVDTLKEDYTQYIPRSHYTKSDELKAYFKTMMWYGRMTFRASGDDETKTAALITLLLANQEDYDHWYNIYEPTNFFVGKSDDLGFEQYYRLLKETYGSLPSLKELAGQAETWGTFKEEIRQLNPPSINSMPIFDETIKHDREEVVKGFRFMGQRFTLDASVFQRLIYREVGEDDNGRRRMLPKGLDIPAAMGSEEAYNILREMGETSYKDYDKNMNKMRRGISDLDIKTRTQNLYWSWLHMLSPLTEPKGESYPMFMQNRAWTRKQLETYMGSWTELKHDTVLYAKQVYAEMGGGGEPDDDRGYVEPNPEVFGRLAALTRMTLDGLRNRDLLKEDTENTMELLETMALRLKTIAEKELTEQPLSESEYELIRSFGGQLEHLWLEALKDRGVDTPSAAFENPAALVTDVATDPNGRVLQEATGNVNAIYVIVPVEGSLRIAKGAVYSYYEFEWPAEDRLTDEKWQNMLRNGEIPDAPSWTKEYTLEGGLFWW